MKGHPYPRPAIGVLLIVLGIVVAAGLRGQPSSQPHVPRYRGTIDAQGYHPPANVTVTWRRPGAPDVVKRLNPGAAWAGGGGDTAGYLARYAEGDSSMLGRQITAIGAEQLGGRAYVILRELYRDAGLAFDPCPTADKRCQAVFDMAIANFTAPAEWCDAAAILGRPDPICGADCQPTRRCGGVRPPATPRPQPTAEPPPVATPEPTPSCPTCAPPCPPLSAEALDSIRRAADVWVLNKPMKMKRLRAELAAMRGCVTPSTGLLAYEVRP